MKNRVIKSKDDRIGCLCLNVVVTGRTESYTPHNRQAARGFYLQAECCAKSESLLPRHAALGLLDQALPDVTSRTAFFTPPRMSGGSQFFGKGRAVGQAEVQLDHVAHGSHVDSADDGVHQRGGDVLRGGQAVKGVKGGLNGL